MWPQCVGSSWMTNHWCHWLALTFPNLNPIKHLWDIMYYTSHTTKYHHRLTLSDAWSNFFQIQSHSFRVLAVIKVLSVSLFYIHSLMLMDSPLLLASGVRLQMILACFLKKSTTYLNISNEKWYISEKSCFPRLDFYLLAILEIWMRFWIGFLTQTCFFFDFTSRVQNNMKDVTVYCTTVCKYESCSTEPNKYKLKEQRKFSQIYLLCPMLTMWADAVE